MKVVYRFKGSPVGATEQAEGQDEVNRLKARLEKVASRPARDRGAHSISGAPQSYTIGHQKRAAQRREKNKCDERMCRQILAGSEKKHGPLHADTLELLQNLAGLLKSQGKVAEADHEMRLLYMRRQMRENEAPRRKAQLNDTYGTGANPSMLMRKVPVKQVPARAKPGLNASSTDTVPQSVAAETPRPPSQPRPQSAPSRRRPNPPPANSFGMRERPASGHRRSQRHSHTESTSGHPSASARMPRPPPAWDTTTSDPTQYQLAEELQESRRLSVISKNLDEASEEWKVKLKAMKKNISNFVPQPPGSQKPCNTEKRANTPRRISRGRVHKGLRPGPSQDPYQELRVRLVEQIAESCVDRVHGESQMVTLLREARTQAFQMSEELQMDPERCAEAIKKLETDLGLDSGSISEAR